MLEWEKLELDLFRPSSFHLHSTGSDRRGDEGRRRISSWPGTGEEGKSYNVQLDEDSLIQSSNPKRVSNSTGQVGQPTQARPNLMPKMPISKN